MTRVQHFHGTFGTNVKTCCTMFYDMQVRDLGDAAINKPKLHYFLLALFWLKRYQTENVTAGISGLHEDTVRKWVWAYAIAMQALKQFKVRIRLSLVDC